jgi:hypothetical protein
MLARFECREEKCGMMERYNSFRQVHRGLRTILFDTALALQKTDFCNNEQRTSAFGRLNLLLNLFDDHVVQESEFILSAVYRSNPELADEFEDEHQTGNMISKRLRVLISEDNDHDAESEKKCGRSILKVFNEFIAFSLYHMNKEEDRVNKELWANYKDEELIEIEQEMIRNSGSKFLPLMEWICKGSNDHEIRHWLTQVRKFAPSNVISSIIEYAEAELRRGKEELLLNRSTIVKDVY